MDTRQPVILTITHHDPSGSAGITADTETAASLGCHCTSVVSAISVGDTSELMGVAPVEDSLLVEQTRAVLEDMPVAAIKVGYLGSVENVRALHSVLHDYPDIPVIIDPDATLADKESLLAPPLWEALTSLLLPYATMACPNRREACAMALEADVLDAMAQELLESGCRYLLLTGVPSNQHLENRLYDERGLIRQFQWERLPSAAYGTCGTLATAIACHIAHGLTVIEAVSRSQQFTWSAIADSRRLGMGRPIPNRLFWAKR
ncbi:bifunctional hydroxymethylpyrimidine kinase/phosphomethylpyrimidine kinase [Microbulbifer thermotolerans]|uniref:hydroxymethylpyrimidine kinase n=1 Tax=Microbulbifer thermotolerans TaxID=252514 RepID=A0A143HJ78_MICTH|nr:hydroxymethylpyrimidine/phosphomethylpyrimidine kinase [Microbulbifer thermotolerans]AMX01556.1 hydroxymethylpyrimidine/phosphomethylpyrimidine kinase [Microbulbifer thermotolerans]MCX2778410.1 hydroxymethylpyrimidine/phosphomethylpyrimidine kinase [Microbulbifer thermotolerans]MCX2784172.1 hydroxymethylpyrimidine/phosphomethylpyrimidine kinase [Microbulbifer thermotolerans]MCX2796179.1 hydroxymethylpyrimidine/phosphomethylpyrimidine kinase [Microbulbifer thermotolerans]MCX2804449.1 hydroxy